MSTWLHNTCVEVHSYTKTGAKIKKPKQEDERKRKSTHQTYQTLILCYIYMHMNIEHFHLQLISIHVNVYNISACVCVYVRIPRSSCRLKNKLTCNSIGEKCENQASIAMAYECIYVYLCTVCTHSSATSTRFPRQMIVSSDAINQRRKIKSMTFGIRVSQLNCLSFVWLTY